MAETTTHIMKECKYKVVRNKKVIGQYTLFINRYWVYVWCFIIDKPHRNKGVGTEILLQLTKRYKRVYICPSNKNSERLYARLGTAISKNDCPKKLLSVFEEIGKIYLLNRKRN